MSKYYAIASRTLNRSIPAGISWGKTSDKQMASKILGIAQKTVSCSKGGLPQQVLGHVSRFLQKNAMIGSIYSKHLKTHDKGLTRSYAAKCQHASTACCRFAVSQEHDWGRHEKNQSNRSGSCLSCFSKLLNKFVLYACVLALKPIAVLYACWETSIVRSQCMNSRVQTTKSQHQPSIEGQVGKSKKFKVQGNKKRYSDI